MDGGTLRSSKEGLCATCYAKASVYCSKCKGRWYCSQSCQAKDWNLGHKGDCGLGDILQVKSPVPKPPARLLAESVERPVHSDASWRKLLESSDFSARGGWPRGLRNVANCCYMNATLQSLYHSVPLLHGALKQHSCDHERQHTESVGCPATAQASAYQEPPLCFRCNLAALSENHLASAKVTSDGDWELEDVVELHDLKTESLNGQTGLVVELLQPKSEAPEARLGVMLPGKASPIAIKTQNLRFLYNRSEVPSPPYEVLRWLPRLNEEFTFGAQEDAHEFFNGLLRLLEDEELKDHARQLQESSGEALEVQADLTALPSRIFGGILVSQCTCTRKECARSSFSFEPFRDLSLEITEATDNLEDMLKLFTAPERLDKQNSWKCEACSEVVRARKQITIYSPPNFLVLHLKRFRFMERGKVTKIVPFPAILNLRPFLSSGASGEGRPVEYELRAVIVHVDKAGYSHFGHYIAFVKCATHRKNTFQWFRIDDSIIQEVEEQQVLQQQAYLLFYTRIGASQEALRRPDAAAGAAGAAAPSRGRCKGREGVICSFYACAEGLCTRCYQEEYGRPPPAEAQEAGSASNGYTVTATPKAAPSAPASAPAPGQGKAAKSGAKPKKVGANDPCPCGSGKKYKKCHGGA
ncbi:unnamed protein product [Durusdinium trenchii]|uniref:ubiquitinyl hydrolase 1 n=1 Tax=Durusdinium trenchii TaxID=1381693 RepID=A0ABP0N9A7_9DINO